MITRMRMGMLAPLLVCLMTACGGGGGGGSSTTTPPPTGTNPPPTTTPPGPTGEDVTNARSAELKASLRMDTKELTITWKDSFAAETGFTVEARSADGTWQVLESLPAGQATGTPYQWQRVISASGTYRVRATRDGYSVPLEIWSDVPQIAVNLDTQMSIELDPAPPVSGPVRLFIANAVDAQAVTYYVDTQTINTSNTGPDFSLNWSSIGFTEGEHLLQATVRLASGVAVDLRRTIVVDNPAIAVSMRVFTRGAYFGDTVWFEGTATAGEGVQQLEFFANGAPLRVEPASGQTSLYYTFYILTNDLPGGPNTFRVVATDVNGLTAEATGQIDINSRPKLTVTSPADGTLTRTTLRLEGSFSEDASTAVVTAFLGDVQILQTAPAASGTFELDYSLAGLPAGEYTLTVRAQDAAGKSEGLTRRVIVPPSQLTYELISSDIDELLATDEGAVLYRTKSDGSIILRSAAGVETTLPIPAGLMHPGGWQLDGGYVVMNAMTTTSSHVFAFTPTGQVKNLSLQGGSTSNGYAGLKRPWVMWLTGDSTADYFQIYNLDTDAVTVVSRPATAVSTHGTQFAMVTTPGAEQFLFTAQTGIYRELTDVFRYDLQTQITDVLTGGDATYSHIRTDNARLAWTKTPLLGTTPELFTAPVANASATTSLGTVYDFQLRDGWAVWKTADYNSTKANDGTGPTVDIGGNGRIYSVADGRVLYDELTNLMTWSATGGKQTLLNNLPISALHNGNSAFITTGSSDAMLLYRLVLP